MHCEEAQELITALVDRELSERESEMIQGHLRDCERCRLSFEYEKALKDGVRSAAERVKAPDALKERILSQTAGSAARASRGGWGESIPGVRNLFARPAWAAVALLVLVLPIFVYIWIPAQTSVAQAALETHEKILSGSTPFQTADSPAALIANLRRSVNGRFSPMGYDLSSMGFQPVGGFVEEMGGRKVLVTIYREGTRTITCFTFLGSEEDAPAEATAYFDAEKRVKFFAYSRGNVHAVLHRSGDRICILVSDMAMEGLLSLARSKAQPS